MGKGAGASEIRRAGWELSSLAGSPGLEFITHLPGAAEKGTGTEEVLLERCGMQWLTYSSPRSLRTP